TSGSWPARGSATAWLLSSNGCSPARRPRQPRSWPPRRGTMTGPGLLLLARRWWWLVGAAALAAAAVMLLVASSAPKTYQAETKLLVGPVSADFDTLHASGELGKTYAELATNRPLLDAAARAARISPAP